MKSFSKILTLFFILIIIFGSVFFINKIQVRAEDMQFCGTNSGCPSGQTCGGSQEERNDGQGTCEVVSGDDGSQPSGGGQPDGNGTDGQGTRPTDSGATVSLDNPTRFESIRDLVAGLIDFFLGGIGVFAIAALIYGGILYIASAGNEEQIGKAKKVITYAVFGLVISILSYVVVNTVIRAVGG